MSENNTPPINETTPSAEEITPTPGNITIPRDIRRDNLDPATRGEANSILQFNIFEKRTYLLFKAIAFLVIIITGTWFLWTGLEVSTSAIGHITEIQKAQLKQNAEKVELAKLVESNKLEQAKAKNTALENPETPKPSITSANSKPDEKVTETVKVAKDSTESKQVKNEKKENKESSSTSDSLGSTMVSTGSIVTLIAFILGAGLTLLLTLLKFTFTANEPTNQNDCVTVAGPLSELLQSLTNYIKKKMGLN
ncbi:hypothetical protein M2G40_20160 [Vibrio vulnificus]|uniref:hypothetical protein n=1 Tax=Vibrio vulnificus TaxID=672 RepID=UPI0013026D79|nr:hypothetical protein [Vibrio vulnificus]EGQ9302716.1 hypothetical protein [Vibrio vulnificus]ELI0351381.1 hypothetical protein [Vibrio vulnificus]ELV8708214.1 hypothetical protein [Vibrio vulnificus]MCU8491359.1 hypothetical protein [Vibrio vulnificus]MCU8510110.1 hypothetical protein [Vibrio vulnificus]